MATKTSLTTPATPAGPTTTEAKKDQRPWTFLVSEGAVIIRRANAIAPMGSALGFAAAAAVVASVIFALGSGLSAGEAVKGWEANQAEINAWAGAATWRGNAAAAASVTRSEDYLAFVNDVAAHPEKLVKQAGGQAAPGTIPCVPMESLSEPWTNPANGLADRPRCKFSGDSVFVASFVQDATTGRSLIYPVLGVFHKQSGAWAYHNFDGGLEGGVFALRDKPSVTIYQIAREVDKAFPGALVHGDVTAPKTAWQWAKKKFSGKTK